MENTLGPHRHLFTDISFTAHLTNRVNLYSFVSCCTTFTTVLCNTFCIFMRSCFLVIVRLVALIVHVSWRLNVEGANQKCWRMIRHISVCTAYTIMCILLYKKDWYNFMCLETISKCLYRSLNKTGVSYLQTQPTQPTWNFVLHQPVCNFGNSIFTRWRFSCYNAKLPACSRNQHPYVVSLESKQMFFYKYNDVQHWTKLMTPLPTNPIFFCTNMSWDIPHYMELHRWTTVIEVLIHT